LERAERENPILQLDAPGPFADTVAAHLRLLVGEAQDLLETFDVVARLEKIRIKASAREAGVASG
jgi:hypothetical protein